MTDDKEPKEVEELDESQMQMGFKLLHPVGRLPAGEIVPVIRFYSPTGKKRNRMAPYLVYHESVGTFRLGRGHLPVYFNPTTKEFKPAVEVTDLTPDENVID